MGHDSAAVLALAPRTTMASAQTDYRESTLADGATLEYRLQLPPGFVAEKAYTVVSASPPGRQNRERVEADFEPVPNDLTRDLAKRVRGE